MNIPLTPDIARAIATDTANAQMRQQGRMAWSQDDYNTAARTLNALLDREEESA